MKIVVSYDPDTGTVTLPDNQVFYTTCNLVFPEHVVEDKTKKVIKLKDAGFSARDIVDLIEGGCV